MEVPAGGEIPETRPPGGKPLVRLLQLIESRGDENAASAAIEAAVPEESEDIFYTRADKFTAFPSRRAPRRARCTKLTGKEGGPVLEDIARQFIEMGPPAGPPTGTGPQWTSLGP